MSEIQVIIFDFDGVIIESNDVKTEAFRRVFARFPEHSAAMMAYHHEHVSLTRFKKFEHLQSLLGDTGPEFITEIARDFSRLVREGLRDVDLVPGAEALLDELSGRWPLYLASVTPIEELKLILEERGLGRWFRDVYGCPPWTKPDAVRDVLQRESATPGRALLIGDSAGDQRCANETGVHFVARDSGLAFDDPQPLKFADCKEILANLSSIIEPTA